MGLWKSLRKFFVKPRPIYEMKITPEQMKRYVSANVQKKLGDLQAINANLRKKIQGLESRIKEVEGIEDEKLIKVLNKERSRLRRERSRKTIGLLFDLRKPILIRSAIRKQRFRNKRKKYLKGFQFEDSEGSELPVVNFIVSPEKKGFKKLTTIRGKPLDKFHELIHDPSSFVQELRMGRVITNITPDEKIIPSLSLKVPVTINNGGEPEETGKEEVTEEEVKPEVKRMREIDVNKISDPDARMIIAALYNKLNMLVVEKQQAEEREQEALTAKLEAESSARALSRGVDGLKALLDASLGKLGEVHSMLRVAMLNEQDMKLKQVLAEGTVMKYAKAIERMKEKMVDIETRTPIDLAKDEFVDDATVAMKLLTGKTEEKEKPEPPKIRKVLPGEKK